MLKNTLTALGVAVLVAAGGCGGDEEGSGAAAEKFVGKWTYDMAKLTLKCGGPNPIEMPLQGDFTVSMAAGGLSLVPASSNCNLPLGASGTTASLKSPQQCEMSGFQSMVLTWTLTSADGVTGDTSFTAKAMGSFAGMPLNCDVTGAGKINKAAASTSGQ